MKPGGTLWIDALNARCIPNSIEIQSPTLTVYPDRQFAETDQPVIIDSATGQIAGLLPQSAADGNGQIFHVWQNTPNGSTDWASSGFIAAVLDAAPYGRPATIG